MTLLGFLFLGFILISYFAGVWVGMQIKKPKLIIRNPKNEQEYREWKNKVSSLGPKRR